MVVHTIFFWLANQGTSAASTLAENTDIPTNIYFSNIAGSLSILCWFIVFTPQFWINYKRQSGESLSLDFLYIWLAGDIMNLVGAIMENLLLTMRILAWYYTIADIALILQIFYYRRTSVKASFESVINASPDSLSSPNMTGEHAPLISGPTLNNYSGVPASGHVHENEHDRVIHQAAMVANATAAAAVAGHHGDEHAHASTTGGQHQRRPSTHSVMTSASGRHRSKASRRRKMARKALMIIFPIVSIAFLIWAYQDWLQCTIGHGEDSEEGSRCGRGNGGGHGKLPPSPSHPPTGEEETGDLMSIMGGGKKHKKHSPEDDKTGFYYTVLPLLLGWGSAVLYLGSRIPQIYKNWRLKSCEGLSIMMFMFSVLGNILYVASIFLNSLEIDYLIKNMPWWLGSGGTLLFDFTIFFQFYIYRHNQPLTEALKEAITTGELDQNALLATADSDDEESSARDDEESDASSTTLNQQNKSQPSSVDAASSRV
ncbi:hypothetical protein BGZ83_002338 [Gryganskiella cystojenkinii]|nr:hypothetical protein BGZ83_002338 [Gryganskiella cystojenkinii]